MKKPVYEPLLNLIVLAWRRAGVAARAHQASTGEAIAVTQVQPEAQPNAGDLR